MLITLKRNVRRSDPEAINDIGAAAMSAIFDNAPYYLIALIPSDAVYTQARLDREAAEQRHKQNLLEAENDRAYDQEQKKKPRLGGLQLKQELKQGAVLF